jgi:hypothetical protein
MQMLDVKNETRLNTLIAGLVVFHGCLVFFRALIRKIIDITYQLQEHLPLLLIFIFLPIAASLLLSTRQKRLGCIVLLGTVFAQIILLSLQMLSLTALTSQFIAPAGWKTLFKLLSFGIIAAEVLIGWLGIRFFLLIHNQNSGS